MKLFLRGFLLLGGITLLLVGAFSLYAHFLLDYSLQNLATVVSATEEQNDSQKLSSVARKVYEGTLQDMALEEAVSGDMNFQNLMLLDLAGRSLNDGESRAGYIRANVYLNKISENKKPARSALFRTLDAAALKVLNITGSVRAFLNYLADKILKRSKEEVNLDLEQYSSQLLLNRAQDKEQKGLWKEAVADYVRFLKAHPRNPDRAMAALAASNILIRQREYDTALKILKKIQPEFSGTEAGDLITQNLKRMNALRAKENSIASLKSGFKSPDDFKKKPQEGLQLGLAYLGTYQWDKAEAVFTILEQSEEPAVKQRATFYLGWISKLNEEYEKSAQIFAKLLEDPSLQADLEMGSRAQLADVYHQSGDTQKSVKEYEKVSQQSATSPEKTREIWTSFSELEMVNIYYFDLKNSRAGRERLDRILNQVDLGDLEAVELKFDEASRINLRDVAFQALVEKKISRALELFNKYLEKNPRDGLTYTGLSTVYALMGDIDLAYENAKKGYELNGSVYATLMLGYVESLLEDYDNAILRYQQVLATAPESIPGRFNLAYVYLQKGEYRKALEIMQPMDASLATVPDKKFLRSKTLNNIGYAHWGLGDMTKASSSFREALRVTPDFAMAQRNLNQLGSGQGPQAAKLIE